jgi:hypothetical protein
LLCQFDLAEALSPFTPFPSGHELLFGAGQRKDSNFDCANLRNGSVEPVNQVEAAKLLNVSTRSVASARKLLEHGSAIVFASASGFAADYAFVFEAARIPAMGARVKRRGS